MTFARALTMLVAAALASAGAAAIAQRVDIGSGSIAETVAKLRPGQFVWAPQVAPEGPMLLIVNLKRQRAVLFRNGVPIAATTVSTGKPGYRTPTGVFTVLQKHAEHYSSKYDNAPMPYMQRLTWQGVALHAGNLPGYPASHGCIRLPAKFAKLLYEVTTLGMTVVVTDTATQPRLAPAPRLVASGQPGETPLTGPVVWTPEKSPSGPVSIVVSLADKRAVVLRNGVEIGSAPVTFLGPQTGSWAYAMRSIENGRQQWMRVQLSPASGADEPVPGSEWQLFQAPEAFTKAVAGIVKPGTTVIVTSDTLQAGATASPLTVIDSEKSPRD